MHKGHSMGPLLGFCGLSLSGKSAAALATHFMLPPAEHTISRGCACTKGAAMATPIANIHHASKNWTSKRALRRRCIVS
jgi:hypothetical protein